jgi:hypothetical protein
MKSTTLLYAAVATGAGNPVQPNPVNTFPQIGIASHVVQVNFGAGLFTALHLRIENGLSDAEGVAPPNFSPMQTDYVCSAADLAVGYAQYSISNYAVHWVRANITVYAPTAGTPPVTVLYLAGKQ